MEAMVNNKQQYTEQTMSISPLIEMDKNKQRECYLYIYIYLAYHRIPLTSNRWEGSGPK